MKFVPLDLPESGATVVVGLSGGVDSTLTALLLKRRGCNVIGVTMSLWDGHIPIVQAEKPFHDACYSPNEKEDIDACRKFCAETGIEYHVIDVSVEYNRQVLDYVTKEYRSGKTPNPCIRCNSFIKFGALLEGLKKLEIDYDYFCTGHYAMVVRPEEGLWGTDKKPAMIACALDDLKDQTYFLYRLDSNLLEKVRFPLAFMKKSEVFKLAKEAGLEAAEKKESQDFVDDCYFDALFSDRETVPGNFVNADGVILGKHKGLQYYTIGQRRGLGISSAKPLYVKKIDAKKNEIVLAEKNDILASVLYAEDFVWAGNVVPDAVVEAWGKIRLRSKGALCQVEKVKTKENSDNGSAKDIENNKNEKWKISFFEKQNAITPGQSVVLYKDNVIIGGGIISEVIDE